MHIDVMVKRAILLVDVDDSRLTPTVGLIFEFMLHG